MRRPRPQEHEGPEARASRQGLSAARVNHEIARQDGLCALCVQPLGVTFAVDHSHKLAETHGHPVTRGCPKCFRAILCYRCNALLGFARDDPELLERAAAYVRLSLAGELRRG